MATNVTNNAGQAGEDPGNRFSPASLVVAVLMMTLAVGAAGGVFGLQLEALILESLQEKGGDTFTQPTEVRPTFSEPASIRPLPTVITNLAGHQGAWVRIEASIVLAGDSEPQDDVLAAEMAEDMVAFLQSVSASEIEGPSGFLNLREDLDERVRLRSDGRVRDLIIHTFIIE